MKFSKQFAIRDRLVKILDEVIRKRKFVHHVLMDYQLSPLEHRVIYGAIEKKNALDEILGRFLKKKARKKFYCHLVISVYMTLFLDTSSNTTIDISAEYAKNNFGSSGLTYALLKNCRKIFSDINSGIAPGDHVRRLELEYSIPVEMGKMFLQDYSFEFIKAFLERKKQTWYRTVKKTPAEAGSVLSEKNISIVWSSSVPEAFSSETPTSQILQLFDKDDIIIQDLCSQQLVQRIIDFKKELKPDAASFFDGCSSPGGKAIGLVPHFENCLLNESDPFRYKILKQRLTGLFPEKNISFTCRDLSAVKEYQKFDVILLDVPCSGLWVINRKPDIRLNFDPDAIAQLQLLQKKILTNSFNFAAKNSIIVYSTCTFNRKENDDIVEEFLARHPDAALIEKNTLLPEGSSGIFYSILRRTA